MKKTLMVTLVLLASVSGLCAQQAGEWNVGGRLGMQFGFHDASAMKEAMGMQDASVQTLVNFNGVVYGTYTIINNLSVQLEANFMIFQGYKLKENDFSAKADYTGIDIPLLAKYSFIDSPLLFGALAGPHFMINMGQLLLESGTGSLVMDEGFGIGITAGDYGGYPLGPGRIVGDLRFIIDLYSNGSGGDFVDSIDYIKRRGIALTVGYEFSFPRKK